MLETAASARALVPRHLRVPLAVAAAAALVVFLALALHVTGDSWASRLDLGVRGLIEQWRALRGPRAEPLTYLGNPVTVVTVAVVVGVIGLLRRDLSLAALAALGPGLSGVAVIALKPVIGRTISDGELSFPSGHTSGAMSIGLLLAFALIRRPARRRGTAAVLLVVLPVAFATVTAIGMVATGAHYPTDTVGGFCSALVVTTAVALATDTLSIMGRRSSTEID